MDTASYPLEDLEGTHDNPCLVVTSPNTQLALKLFQHTMKTLGKIEDVKSCVHSLVKQGISDLIVSNSYFPLSFFSSCSIITEAMTLQKVLNICLS